MCISSLEQAAKCHPAMLARRAGVPGPPHLRTLTEGRRGFVGVLHSSLRSEYKTTGGLPVNSGNIANIGWGGMAGKNGSPGHSVCGNGHTGMGATFGWAWNGYPPVPWPSPPWQARHTTHPRPNPLWPAWPFLLLISHRLCVTFYFPCQLWSPRELRPFT